MSYLVNICSTEKAGYINCGVLLGGPMR